MKALLALALSLATLPASAIQPAVFFRMTMDQGVPICHYHTPSGAVVKIIGTFGEMCPLTTWVP